MHRGLCRNRYQQQRYSLLPEQPLKLHNRRQRIADNIRHSPAGAGITSPCKLANRAGRQRLQLGHQEQPASRSFQDLL